MTRSTTTPVWRSTGAGVACAAVLVVGAAVGPAMASAAFNFKSDLRDFAPTAVGPFDHARAKLTLVGDGSTQAVFVVHGVDPGVAGQTFGAHLHLGPCVAGSGAAALGHYNHSTSPRVVSSETEIWLDVTINDGGNAQSTARVDWAPLAGTRSVVIHARPTAADGTAGDRLACLPVEW